MKKEMDFNYLKNRTNKKNEINKKRKKGILSKIRNLILDNIPKGFVYNFLSKDVNNLILKEIELLDKNNSGLKILFISDLHLGIVDNNESLKLALSSIDCVDLVVFGGDYFDNDKIANNHKKIWDELINILKEKASLFIGVLGNHDDFNIVNIVSKDIKLLLNESFTYKNIVFYGVEDYVTFNDIDDFDKIDNEKYNILISHTPDFIEKVKNPYDLMLSGHTHGGQIKILGYKLLVHCKRKKMSEGKWEIDGIKGFTTTGLGCSGFPFRRGVNPELVLFKFK